MTNCSIWLSGNSKEHWNTHSIDIKNIINNKPVYFYKNTSGLIVSNNTNQVILFNCTDLEIINQNFSYGGVILAYTYNSSINNNTFINSNIHLVYSTNNSVTDNLINDPGYNENCINLASSSDRILLSSSLTINLT